MTTPSSSDHGNSGQQVGHDQGHSPNQGPGGGPIVEVHTVVVRVNYKDVQVLGPRTTGAGIKEAAIAQGVAIQADFVLSLVSHDGARTIVHDDDVVTVHPGSEFVAVGPDDNS